MAKVLLVEAVVLGMVDVFMNDLVLRSVMLVMMMVMFVIFVSALDIRYMIAGTVSTKNLYHLEMVAHGLSRLDHKSQLPMLSPPMVLILTGILILDPLIILPMT